MAGALKVSQLGVGCWSEHTTFFFFFLSLIFLLKRLVPILKGLSTSTLIINFCWLLFCSVRSGIIWLCSICSGCKKPNNSVWMCSWNSQWQWIKVWTYSFYTRYVLNRYSNCYDCFTGKRHLVSLWYWGIALCVRIPFGK